MDKNFLYGFSCTIVIVIVVCVTCGYGCQTYTQGLIARQQTCIGAGGSYIPLNDGVCIVTSGNKPGAP